MSTETAHLIAPTTSATGEVEFQLPIDASLIASFEAVDLDLMLISTTGEKFILQQGALQAAINPASKLLFNNGESLSAADQIKRLGILKPVEGGSFRLASATLPDSPEIISGNEFGLGKEAQDTAAKIEKILQALEAATQSNTADTPHSTTANGGTKTSSREAAADPLASPSPGAPPAPEEIKNTNTSDVKVNSTSRAFTGSDEPVFDGLLVKAPGSTNADPAKQLKQIDLTQVNIDKLIQVDLHNQTAVDLSKNQGTLTLPGVLNATKLELTLEKGQEPNGFSIKGLHFDNRKIVITDVKSLTDLKLQVDWDAKSTESNATSFEVGVAYFNGTTKLDYGNTTLYLVYGDSLPETKLDGNGNLKIFLSQSGYSYSVAGTNNNDHITTGGGNDTLNGGFGVNIMAGGKGDDIYIVDSTTDIITELDTTGSGTDTVQSSVTFSLVDTDGAGTNGGNIEKLTLTEGAAIDGTGNGLSNIITGNGANNTLDGGTNTGSLIDTLVGGAGDDIYIVDSTNDIITELATAGSGTDTVQSSVTFSLVDTDGAGTNGGNIEKLTLIGLTAIDGTGNGLNNTITGNSFANTLNGGEGIDALIGGAGDDIYIVDSTTDIITETTTGGTDTVQSSVTFSLVDTDGAGANNGGNIENLTLIEGAAIGGTGNSLNNTITGNTGDNILIGLGGSDVLDGSAGIDAASYIGSLAVIIDLVTGIGSGGDAEGDVLVSIENLIGSGNNDTFISGIGANRLDGALGTDTVSYASSAAVTVNLLANVNTGGNAAEDQLTNIENVTGSAFADNLTGDNGNNVINGGAGADVINGGNGTDTVDYTGSAAVQINLATGVNTGGDAQGDQLTSIERVIGSANNDSLIGFASMANYLDGGSGDDTLTGGTVIDTLIGGVGNDTFKGSLGADTIYGGTTTFASGSDTVDYSTSTAAVTVDLKLTTAQSGGDAADDILSNISNLVGSNYADTLVGTSLANMLSGGIGNDTITGGGGADTLVAGDGADTLTGNTGVDTFDLATGNTSLAGDKALSGVGTGVSGGGDTFIINANQMSSIDSATQIQGTSGGTDILRITGTTGATLDLTALSTTALTSIVSINTVDVSNDGVSSSVKLNLATIQGLVDASSGIPTLSIKLDTGDSISFQNETGITSFDNTTSHSISVFSTAFSSLVQVALINY